MEIDKTVYAVLGGMIGYRTKGLPWHRQTRLRVTEFLTDTPLYSLKSSKEIPEWKIRDLLDTIHPDWHIEEQYYPTPDQTAKQITALCVKFSREITDYIGLPTDYADIGEIMGAIVHMREIKS